MLPEKEWLFFEATEQRIKAWTQKERANAVASWCGRPYPHSLSEQIRKRAAILQEMEYPDRLEAALRNEGLAPERRRRLDLHRRWMVETAFRTHPEIAALEQEMLRTMTAFEPKIQGASVTWSDLETILCTESDRELREAAWKAGGPLERSLEPGMAELLRLREAWAQSLIGTGFAAVAYHVAQLERVFVVNFMDTVERTTRSTWPAVMERLARAADVQDAAPWDYFFGLTRLLPPSFPGFSENAVAEAAERQVRQWGWGHSPESLAREFCSRPGRTQVIGGPDGVTLIGRPGAGAWSVNRFLRAYGNGVHRLLAGGNRFFLETPSAVQAEATGAFLARILMDPEWLSQATGASAPAVDAVLAQLRDHHLVTLRFYLCHNTFENVAYTHANVEPTRLFQDVWEQVFHGTRQQTAAWAAMRSYVETPFDHATPVLGSALGAQLWDAMEAGGVSPWRSAQAGKDFLKEWITPGAQTSWEDTLQDVTHGELDLRSFCQWLELDVFEGPRLEDSESISDNAAEAYFSDIDLSDLDPE